MATGDMQGNLERLRVQLRTIGYPHPLDLHGLKDGNPASILPLLHYALLGYSRHVSRYLSENGYALFAKSDLRFVECTLKYLREEFNYRCPLTVAQIFSRGFAERKFLFVYDVIQVCKRKHSELVKLARQAHQARKIFKGETTMSEVAKHINAATIDSVHMDETSSEALEQASKVQERSGGKNSSKTIFNISKLDMPELEKQPQEIAVAESTAASNEHNEGTLHQIKMRLLGGNNNSNSKPHKLIEVIRSTENISSEGNEARAVSKSSAHPPEAMEGSEGAEYPSQDVNDSLSQCYGHLRQQIVDVADKLERRLLSLEGDVQRMTADLQTKLSNLERQTQFLEQILPSQPFSLGRRAAAQTYENLHIYDRAFPLRRSDESLHIPFSHMIRDISNTHQNHLAKSLGMSGVMDLEIPPLMRSSYLQQQQRLSTQELIASVKARCNKTKELLMENGWNAPS